MGENGDCETTCDERCCIGVMFSEHIWPVTVKAKGLSGNRDKGIPPGSYRLCLTNTDVSLIRLYSDKPDVVVPVSSNYHYCAFSVRVVYIRQF